MSAARSHFGSKAIGTVDAWLSGCRCIECAKAARNAAARKRAKDRRTPVTATHGKASTYSRGCRCDPCRVAMAAADRARRTERKSAGEQPPTHGVTGYNKFGCRCDVCRTAAVKAVMASRKRVADRKSAAS